MYSLEQIADLLDAAQRHGVWPDRKDGARLGAASVSGGPGPEITDRYIKMSDRLARNISAALRHHAKGEPARAVPLERR